MSNSSAPARKPLRVWPGVVAVAALWIARFGVKAVVPGFTGFARGMMGAIVSTLVVLAWWTLFSRAPLGERFGALALMALGLGAAWVARDVSMGPVWFIGYAIPLLSLAFVAWGIAARRLPDRTRWMTMTATILLSCGVWTLVRMTGINGDHVAQFEWRWTASHEERLLAASANAASQAKPPAPERPAAPADVAPAGSAKRAIVTAAPDPPATATSLPIVSTPRPDWPSFRGPARDGVIRLVRIDTDWSQSPPVQLWRRAVGPGWSSFAVGGDVFYTQEQRGEEELVTAYSATTGQPLWTHRTAARFFESNAGAGPRATPTLHNGRLYAFGATGILNALDAASGVIRWSRNVADDTDMGIPIWGFASSPLVVDDIVIVAAAGQLAAYDRASGERRWHGPAGGGGYSSPHLLTMDGVAQVLLVNDRGVRSVAPADGTALWEHKWPGSAMVQPAVTADGDILITDLAGGTRRISVTHAAGGWSVQERWTSTGLKPYLNDFVVHKGHAFGFDGRILACIDLADGARKWKGGRYGNGQLVLLADQDLLLVLSEEGELALVRAKPEQFTEIARFPALEGKTWNHPVLAGDVLLVRNDHEMAAFRLTPARH